MKEDIMGDELNPVEERGNEELANLLGEKAVSRIGALLNARQQRVKDVLRVGNGKLLAKRSTNRGYFDIFLEEGSTRQVVHPATFWSLLKSKEIWEVQRQKLPGGEDQIEYRIVEPLERLKWIIERVKHDDKELPTYRQLHAERAVRETLEEVAPLLDRDIQRTVQKVLNLYYQSLKDEQPSRDGHSI